MSQFIPQPSALPAHRDSPTLLTPSGSPPTTAASISASFENRLNELLAHFDSGTHEFCRQERETPEEKAVAWGSDNCRSPLLRRPSLNFLSALSMSRPFPSQPSGGTNNNVPPVPPLPTNIPKHFPGLAMATGTPPAGLHRATTVPHFMPKAPTMERAQSSPTQTAAAVLPSEDGLLAPSPKEETKRRFSNHHFDPSREPKLLGLL